MIFMLIRRFFISLLIFGLFCDDCFVLLPRVGIEKTRIS